jgi:hypothetical protein
VLAFTVVGAAAGCGDSKPRVDAAGTCETCCIPQGPDSGSNCPAPTCATGGSHDVCSSHDVRPQGCIPEPIA